MGDALASGNPGKSARLPAFPLRYARIARGNGDAWMIDWEQVSAKRPRWRVQGGIIHRLFRVARFGLVGVFATATHAACALTALALLPITPVFANFLGFTVAFCVSMAGHALFTFGMPMTVARAMKFCVVAVASVCVSSGIVLFLDAYTALAHAQILTLAAVCTPVFNFICHSLWTFRGSLGLQVTRG